MEDKNIKNDTLLKVIRFSVFDIFLHASRSSISYNFPYATYLKGSKPLVGQIAFSPPLVYVHAFTLHQARELEI